MKGKYPLFGAIGAIAAGLLLMAFPNEAGNYFVILIGLLFMLPSCIGIVSYFSTPRELRPFFPIGSVGGVLFGFLLMVMPGFFADFLTFVLGFLVLMGGVQQIASLTVARQWEKVPLAMYIIPALIIVAGLVAVFNPMGTRSAAFILIGACCLVYGLSSIYNWYKFGRHNPNIHAGKESAQSGNSSNGTVDAEDATDETILQHNDLIRRKIIDKHGDNVEEAEIIE